MTDALKQPEELRILADAIDPKEIMASGIAIPFNERQKREHSAAAALREYAESLERKPAAYMIEYYGSDCGPQYEIYKADDMGWRDKSQYTPLYSAPQPAAPQAAGGNCCGWPGEGCECQRNFEAGLSTPQPAAPQAVNQLDALLTQIINRRVVVEQQLFDMAAGKLPMPDKDKLRELAVYLGTPASQPPTPAPAQAVPLTDAQIRRLHSKLSLKMARDTRSFEAFKRTARLIEAAHGIKQPGSEAC